MKALKLFIRLKKDGWSIGRKGTDLRLCSPIGAMTDEIRAELMENKANLIKLLENTLSFQSGAHSVDIICIDHDRNLAAWAIDNGVGVRIWSEDAKDYIFIVPKDADKASVWKPGTLVYSARESDALAKHEITGAQLGLIHSVNKAFVTDIISIHQDEGCKHPATSPNTPKK